MSGTHVLEVPKGSLEVPPYSLIEIIPNDSGTEIDKIQCAYVFGLTDSESLYRSYDRPDIRSMIHIGSGMTRNLLDKIIACVKMDSEDPPEQGMINQFIAGIGITMFAYNIGRYDACDVGDPYYPVEVALPDEARAATSEVEMLTESMFDQYNQAAKIVIFTDIMCIGKQWAKEIITFWNTWGHCFEAGTQSNSMDTMYKATSSCLQYIISSKQHQHTCGQNSHMCKTLEYHASEQISRMCDTKEKLGCSMDSIVDCHKTELKQTFDTLSTDLDDLRVTSFDDVTKQSELALSAISDMMSDAKCKLLASEESMRAKIQSQIASHVTEVIHSAECELKEILKKLVDENLERYIAKAVSRIDNPMTAKVAEMNSLLESCKKASSESKKASSDAKRSATDAKNTASRRKQTPSRPVPGTPDDYRFVNKLSDMDSRLNAVEECDLKDVLRQLNRINRVLRL